MTADTEGLERELVADLGTREERLADGWGRAEEIVNEPRRREDHDPLTLAQTGGEGEVSGTVEEELGRLGWRSAPLDPERHDSAHATRPDSPPPSGQGETESPTEDSHAWERQAHREAEESRGRAAPVEGRGDGG